MRTPDFDLRTAFNKTLEENESLKARAFPELGSVFTAGWPIPASVKLREAGQASVLEFKILPVRQARPTEKIFTEFLALAEGWRRDDGNRVQNAKVLKFAEKYGPLGLRRDGGYLFHPSCEQREEGGQAVCVATEWVGSYVGLARSTACLINLSRDLRRIARELMRPKSHIAERDLKRLWGAVEEIARGLELDRRVTALGRPAGQEDMVRITTEVDSAKLNLPQSVDGCWRLVMDYLEIVVGSNPFGLPMLFTLERDTSIRLQPVSSLKSYLQLHTLTAVGKSPGVTVCAGCRQVFTPRRQIPINREAWCPKCGVKAAQRAAARRYYAKNKTRVLERVHSARKREVVL